MCGGAVTKVSDLQSVGCGFDCRMWHCYVTALANLCSLTSTWPHLRGDVGLEEGEYKENCLFFAVLCIIIMVHKDTSSSCRSVDCIGL